ncbi:MAG: Fic family protein [Candidatus Micrarchaeota archaeon]
MAFIEKQKHGKYTYYYLVKSFRTSPTKVEKVRIFLGSSVPSKEKLQELLVELEKKAPKTYSAKHLDANLIEQLEDLRASTIIFKSFPDDAIPKDFVVRFTYNSNAIEGNPLTLRETALVLTDKIAPQGTGTDAVIEAMNGKDAWDFAKGYKGQLNEAFIRKLQYQVAKNTACRIQGDYRDLYVRITGSEWKPPKSEDVPKQMANLCKGYSKKRKQMHPVELAGWMHNRLVQIHPFTDGNGRTSRLVLNWILMKSRFPPIIIYVKNKQEYYSMIEAGDKGNEKPFANFLAKQLIGQYTFRKEGKK